ncbi:uncharacterized protein B0H64DRAFT_448189 [Chaetomium fimeti]|uniref:Uncharacterized protein n=1 Tax=Chaetomium fimeti TaxID=1854472 RepID=A0AAE0HP67_9PEZI|nr:hypothetical protein B0H64DRAFT_448189 [Chaetomium fimeti]
MVPSSEDCDDTWVCPPCRLSILMESSRQPLKPLKPLKKSKPPNQRPNISFHLEEQTQPVVPGDEGSTGPDPKRPIIKVFIDLRNVPGLEALLNAEPFEAPKLGVEGGVSVQEPQLDGSKPSGEPSRSQDANGPGAASTETQPPPATRRTSGPFLDFLHPPCLYSGLNTARSPTATRAKSKKPKGEKRVKGRRGKQKGVEDGTLPGLKTQDAEKTSEA